MMGNCKRCYYWTKCKDSQVDMGRCHRYPNALIKDGDDYCGEYCDVEMGKR